MINNENLIRERFIGGVTFAEIAALRLLGRLRNYQILIAASHIINRKQLLDLISDDQQ